MHNHTQVIKPEDIIKILLRRRWVIIIPFCLSMIIGIFLVLFLPKIYSAETLVLLQSQRVNTEFVRPITNADVDAMVNTISQQILSRSNLKKIIKEFKLFSGPKLKNMFWEDKIADMRKRISTNVKRSRDYRQGIESFIISFKGEEPEVVMKVTNALAKNFISENLQKRETYTKSTSESFDKELSVLKERLKESEQSLKDFRKEYSGGLPEQLETNLRTIDRLSDQLISKQQRLQDEKNRLHDVENGLSERQVLQTTEEVETYDTSNYYQLVAQLRELKTRYTDQHPDIIRLKKRIANLDNEAQTPEENLPYKNIRKEIKRLEAEVLDLMRKVSHYEDLVENTPKREQELTVFQRDFDNINATYNSYLERKREAALAVNMEKKQKMEQFRIIDYASQPEKPSEPNMVNLFWIIIAAGLGIGGGLIFVLEYLDTSIRKPSDIEFYLGIPVLSTIPIIYQPRDIIKKRFNQILSFFSIMASSLLLILFSMLVFIGENLTVELAKKFISI